MDRRRYLYGPAVAAFVAALPSTKPQKLRITAYQWGSFTGESFNTLQVDNHLTFEGLQGTFVVVFVDRGWLRAELQRLGVD